MAYFSPPLETNVEIDLAGIDQKQTIYAVQLDDKQRKVRVHFYDSLHPETAGVLINEFDSVEICVQFSDKSVYRDTKPLLSVGDVDSYTFHLCKEHLAVAGLALVQIKLKTLSTGKSLSGCFQLNIQPIPQETIPFQLYTNSNANIIVLDESDFQSLETKSSYTIYFVNIYTTSGELNRTDIYLGEFLLVRGISYGWSDELVSLVPAMTGYTTPSGEVVYSANYEDRYAWHAFDGTDSQTYSDSAWSDGTNPIDGDPESVYCGYLFPTGTEVKIHSVTIACYADRTYSGILQAYIGGEWQTVAENIVLSTDNPVRKHYKSQDISIDDVVCTGIRLCVTSGSEPYFGSQSYGGNICEITVNGYNKL